jgi:hypothetical protein
MNRRKRLLEDLDQDIRDHIDRETQDNTTPNSCSLVSGTITLCTLIFDPPRGKRAVCLGAVPLRSASPMQTDSRRGINYR